jgi:hypothetical protein
MLSDACYDQIGLVTFIQHSYLKLTHYCFHFVHVIRYGLSQSDHIKSAPTLLHTKHILSLWGTNSEIELRTRIIEEKVSFWIVVVVKTDQKIFVRMEFWLIKIFIQTLFRIFYFLSIVLLHNSWADRERSMPEVKGILNVQNLTKPNLAQPNLTYPDLT